MSNRARWLLLTPALVGAALASLVLAVAVNPAWQRLQAREAELAELRQKEKLMPLLRQQLLQELNNRERAEGRRRVLLAMVEGSGSHDTLMAQVGGLAQASGVKVTLYEPKAATGAAATAAAGAPGSGSGGRPTPPPAPPPAAGAQGAAAAQGAVAQADDPLAVEGLERRELLLSARGPFPALLAFLRDLERLQVLVVQSDLELSLAKSDQAKPGTQAQDPVTLKLALGLYSRPAPAADRRPSRPRPGRPTGEPE